MEMVTIRQNFAEILPCNRAGHVRKSDAVSAQAGCFWSIGMTHQSDAAGSKEVRPLPLSSSPSRPTQIGRITAVQARMARAAIKKTLAEVAEATGCTKMTLSRFENGGALSGKTTSSIRSFYESHGVQFVADAYYHAVRAPK